MRFKHKKFKARIDEMKIEPKDIALVAGVSLTAVYAWMNGTSEPRARHLVDVMPLLGVDPEAQPIGAWYKVEER